MFLYVRQFLAKVSYFVLLILPSRLYNIFKQPLIQRTVGSDLVWSVKSHSYVDIYEYFGRLKTLCLNVYESVHRDTNMKVTNKMQLCRL